MPDTIDLTKLDLTNPEALPVPEELLDKYRYDFGDDSQFTAQDEIQAFADECEEKGLDIEFNWRETLGKHKVKDYKVVYEVGGRGDGVGFEARIYTSSMTTFLDAHDLQGRYPLFEEYLRQGGGASFHVEPLSRSAGFSYMEFEDYGVQFSEVLDDEAVADLLQTQFETTELDPLEDDLKGAVEALADTLYERLEAEYNWTSSDEYITDVIRNNLQDELVEYWQEQIDQAAYQEAA